MVETCSFRFRTSSVRFSIPCVIANALGVSSGAGIPVMWCLDLIGRVAGNGDHKMERA